MVPQHFLARLLPLAASLSLVLCLPLSVMAQPVAAPDCNADVELSADGGLKVSVVYRCRADTPLTFGTVGQPATSRVLSFTDATGKPLTSSSNAWWVEPVNGLVEAHYSMDLLGYAQQINNPTMAIARGDGVYTLLEAWLLEPRGFKSAPVIDIRVKAAEGLSFATGLPKVGDAWRLSGTVVRFAGYSALGKFALETVAVPMPGSLRPNLQKEGQAHPEGVLRVAMFEGFSEQGRADLLDWVKRTAEAESNYWQGFTAPQLLLGLVPMEGRKGVGFGRTVPGGGASVMIEVGMEVDKKRLFNEWVLVHELIHTGMPYINGRGTWLMEGAATYVEPVIRARAGWKTEAEVWKEWVDSMPRGAPVFGVGLANAEGNQNYWGGAIFMLMADIGIRRATKGAKGLEDCLGGVLWSGHDAMTRMNIKDFAQSCDRAVQSDVVSTLVDRHLLKQNPVDLNQMWKDLGVAEVNGRITLDDKAPQAEWRKMIVMGPSAKSLKPVKLPWQS